MIQFCKANQQDYEHFDIAAKYYFNFAMTVNGSSVMSCLNFALYQQFVKEDPFAAEHYYKQALRVAPGSLHVLQNLADFLTHRGPQDLFYDPGPPTSLVPLCTRVAFNSRTRSVESEGTGALPSGAAPTVPAAPSTKRVKAARARALGEGTDDDPRSTRPEDVLVIPDAVLRSSGWVKLFNPAEDRPSFQNFWYNTAMDVTAWRRPTFHIYGLFDVETAEDLDGVGFEATPAMLAGILAQQDSTRLRVAVEAEEEGDNDM